MRGELAYASAGHPPPLLRDDDTGAVMRLDHAQAPPLGVSRSRRRARGASARCRGAQRCSPTPTGSSSAATASIDEGIERLERRSARPTPALSADELADTLIRDVAEVTAADDDIALLVMRLLARKHRGGGPASHEAKLSSYLRIALRGSN